MWVVILEDKGNGAEEEEGNGVKGIGAFPNKKTALNYDEFCELYDQAHKSAMSDDAMITAIFDMFDYDK